MPVVDEVFDLFVSLDANDEQLDFPILYASGRDGWCTRELDDPRENLHPLLDLVVAHVPAPDVAPDQPFAMLATLLDSHPYLGRCLTGRVIQGTARVNTAVKAIDLDGEQIEAGRLTKLLRFEGTQRVPVDEVQTGDLICIAGLAKASVADTICDPQVDTALTSTPVDPPTMSVTITVNDSPFAGKEGKKVTSTMIRERLLAEAETNVAITFSESAGKDAFEIGGRGELQRCPCRDDAPRGVRDDSLAPARPGPPRERAAARADRGGHHRCRRGICQHSRRCDEQAQGDDAGHAVLGRRQDACRLPCPVARPDRLSQPFPDRNPRHWRSEPGLPQPIRITRAIFRAAATAR